MVGKPLVIQQGLSEDQSGSSDINDVSNFPTAKFMGGSSLPLFSENNPKWWMRTSYNESVWNWKSILIV